MIDLRRPEGSAALLRLVDMADVLIEGYRPGVAERLGFGPGMLLAFGIGAALWERERSGAGQVVDAAIIDGVATMLTMQYGFLSAGHARDERGVNMLDSGAPFYDVYETADSRWMAVGAIEAPFYRELLRVLELADIPPRGDPANWSMIRTRLAQRFAEEDRDTWVNRFAGSDACVAPVLSLNEAPRDEHLAARGTYTVADGAVQPAVAPRFSRTPGATGVPPRQAGQDTESVLEAWGIDDVADLIAVGAVVQSQTPSLA